MARKYLQALREVSSLLQGAGEVESEEKSGLCRNRNWWKALLEFSLLFGFALEWRTAAGKLGKRSGELSISPNKEQRSHFGDFAQNCSGPLCSSCNFVGTRWMKWWENEKKKKKRKKRFGSNAGREESLLNKRKVARKQKGQKRSVLAENPTSKFRAVPVSRRKERS
jgi:hypothetical protein